MQEARNGANCTGLSTAAGEEDAPIDICTQESEENDHKEASELDGSAELSSEAEEDAISDSDEPEPSDADVSHHVSTTSDANQSAKDVIDLLEDDSDLEIDIAEDEIEDIDDEDLEVLQQPRTLHNLAHACWYKMILLLGM